ncbi:phosphoserine transaminase [Gulosibacter faecalis]|jgi:phosphoserine aminotransferase|uniref:phosphoserine transaminase n=1 Tax=Gulosibacter faecalis TaxID=272240 RepID=A0ABW5UTN0_9MICO|nr:phosphoserine transaminase [Gulosibacter faecalis]
MSDIRIPANLLPGDGRFGAGPSRVRESQLDDLVRRGRDVLGTSHRQAPVKQLVASVRAQLGDLYGLPEGYEVVLGNGGATAFWDAAAFGLIERRAQAASFGEFGSKFARAAGAPWLEAPDVREAPGGEVALLEPAAGIDLYATPHNETSTGAMVTPTRVANDEGALTLIDATSAAGGIEVDLEQADVYYFSPQKNFGSDGGLWFALMSPAALERVARLAASDRYIPESLSLQLAVENSRKEQTLNTPAIATLSLLDSQLRWMLADGGLPTVAARTRASSDHMYQWAAEREWATPFVRDEQYRSQVIATIDLDERVDSGVLRGILRENGIVDVDPYRKLGRNQLRVGTFASVPTSDVEQLTASIDYVVERLLAN